MPTSADLFELFFMGPGLLCFVPVIMAIVPLTKRLRARGRRRREEAVVRLTGQASELLGEGRVGSARAAAEKAVSAAGRKGKTMPTLLGAHLALATILVRDGDDGAAVEHLRQAIALSGDDLLARAQACANMSLILRRMGKTAEAVEQAAEAVRIHHNLDAPSEVEGRATVGRAHAALALAQTDDGQDGRRAAYRAWRVFHALEEEAAAQPERSADDLGDSMALACYANGYALAAQKDASASDFANEAWERYSRLHSQAPLLYRNRLADAAKLLDSL